MLKKFFAFLSNLFGGLFGRKKTTTSPTPTTNTEKPTEVIEPQDGSEIRPDSTVVVYDENTSEVVVDNPPPTDIVVEEPVEQPIPDNISDTQIEEDHSTTTPSQPNIPTTPNNTNPETGNTSTSPQTNPSPVSETNDLPETPDVPVETEAEVEVETPQQTAHQQRYLWCLDNGHGKLTAGKRSPKLENGDQLFEYEFNRDIVKRISTQLDEKGVAHFNVVPEVDIDNFLEGRVKRANTKKSDIPKLFVSIHSNAAPALPGKWSSPSINGIETWYYHRSKKGKAMASIFQKHIVQATGWNSRNIKSQAEKQFFVLRKTNMIAVLTENGFYNNKAQCKELLKNSVRQKIADAHVEAILEIEAHGLDTLAG